MILLLILLQFSGCFLIYNASGKTAVRRSRKSVYLRDKLPVSRLLGWLLVAASVVGLTLIYGFGAGFFYGLVVLMTIFSLQLLLVPMNLGDRPRKSAKNAR